MTAGCSLEPERFTERLYDRIARKISWSPIGERLAVSIEDSADERLMRQTLYGTIRACDVRSDGTPTDLVIELDAPIQYAGHYRRTGIRWLVARPCFQWRRTNRLLLTWAAVRVMDAPALVDATYDKTIGTARLRRI